jgi:hypothetical protein
VGNLPRNLVALQLYWSKVLVACIIGACCNLRANIGVDRENMLAAGGKYYVLAMEELRKSIAEDSVDYVGLLTTLMTFLFIEVCIISIFPRLPDHY